MLSSTHQGEQIAAINSIQRTLKSSKISWTDFVQSLGGAEGHSSYSDSVTFQAGYSAGYSAGYEAACDQHNSETLYPNKEKYYSMLCKLERHGDKLNNWGREFVKNILRTYFAENNNKRLTAKQCACIEKMYNQFC